MSRDFFIMERIVKNILLIMLLLFSNFIDAATDNQKYMGVCFHPEKIDADNSKIFQLLKKYRFISYRTDYRWQLVELEKDSYKVPDVRLDRLIKESNRNGITPLLILGYRNSLYGTEKPKDDISRFAFANYVAWVVNRYKEYDVNYEIYNEWWLKDLKGHNIENVILSAKDYLALIKQVSMTIRSISPSSKIIAGSLNPLNEQHVKWLGFMMQEGLMDYIDGVSIHPYSLNDPEYDFQQIDFFQKKISEEYNKNKSVDIYITEMGYSDTSNSKINPLMQVQYIREYLNLVNERSYVKGIWWYQLVNENNHTEYESNLGLLNRDFSEKLIMKGWMSD
ncbi:hypothetical protein A9493_00005 [Klebsiella pneumoniae]|nr:hypothetical protein A9493_00005 [Klebsiella pneumoniae]OUY30171.1 hypothetical protein BLK92_33765 [Klebsiella pneumoniae]